MFIVAVKLGVEVLIDPVTGINWTEIIIALLSATAFLTIKKINSAYIVLGGSALGYLLYLI